MEIIAGKINYGAKGWDTIADTSLTKDLPKKKEMTQGMAHCRPTTSNNARFKMATHPLHTR